MAVVGGVVLAVTILMICLSITGRTMTSILHSGFMQTNLPALADWLLGLRIGPIRGDFELVEAAMAFSVFAFLAWCQVTSGHATVDIFTDGLRPWARRVLQAVIELVFAVVLVYIALKLHEGMQIQQRRRTTTFLLQMPLWWSYMAALIPAYLAAAVGCYMAAVRVFEAILNRPLIRAEAGAGH
ncbi:MAG: TRAP transporter small permease [Pararhodobacter sp.]|nr:TRAP transporter small permease [Pararhodobacter sp.]